MLQFVSFFYFDDKRRVVVVDARIDATGNLAVDIVDVLELEVAHIRSAFYPPPET